MYDVHAEIKLESLSTPVEYIREFVKASVLSIFPYSSSSHKGVLRLSSAYSWRRKPSSVPRCFEVNVPQLCQESFQVVTLEVHCVSGLFPSGTFATAGWPKRWVITFKSCLHLYPLLPFFFAQSFCLSLAEVYRRRYKICFSSRITHYAYKHTLIHTHLPIW